MTQICPLSYVVDLIISRTTKKNILFNQKLPKNAERPPLTDAHYHFERKGKIQD